MTRPRPAPRTALVHEWLVTMRGAERVLEVFAELLPDADLFTLVHAKGALSKELEARRIRTSFIQRLPFGVRKYRHFLPLMPAAIEALDLSGYDAILSSSFCVAKGVVARPDARHVSYVHTPMRYVWEQQAEYFGEGRAGPLTRAVAALTTPWLRTWDEASANRPDRVIANSHHVARRVKKRWNRDADVLHPPVDCARFPLSAERGSGGYYVMLGAFAPYKRVDLAIDAFQRLGKRLLVGGGGQEGERLKARLKPGSSVQLVGDVKGAELASFLGNARAFVFPGEEDFGIAPVEAQACGVPVIAFGRGGATETVVDVENDDGRDPTGVWFHEQTVDGLCAAVEEFERREKDFSGEAIRRNALTFDRPVFKAKLRNILQKEFPGVALG